MSDEKPSIEERIRRDVNSILTTTGRLPKLVYLVNQIDADTLVPAGRKAPVRLQLATSGGMVVVAVDRWCPIGSVHRSYECSCGALFVDDREKCSVCMMNSLAETICELRSQPAATVTATCARCSATIDPAAVEQHHAVCFVSGDPVRWTSPLGDERWAEGEVLHVDCIAVSLRIATVSARWLDRRPVEGTFVTVNRDLIRHIQRPGQAVRDIDPFEARAAAYHKLASEAPGPIGCAHGDDDDDELQDAMEAMEDFTPILPPEVDPLDVVYDGIELRDLLFIDEADRLEISGPRRRARRTDAQRAAVSAHWSQQLRARISAAKERERLSVTYCEVDVEDEPW